MSETFEEHLGYISDRGRLELFRAAFAELVRPGDVVADLGCGFGVLGLLCLQAGAARVWGIDRTEAIEIARETMDRAGWADRYNCIREHTYRATLPERVDLLVCDHVGMFGLDYGIVAMVADARRRLLKPGGRIFPGKIQPMLAGASSGPCREMVAGWNAPGVPPEFGRLRDFAINTKHPHTFARKDICTLPATLGTVDLAADNPNLLVFETMLVANRECAIDGFAGWFECELTEGVRMTNSPFADNRIERAQVFLPFTSPIDVAPGDEIEARFSIRHDDNVLSWSARALKGGRRQKQSTWNSRILNRDDFETLSDRIPILGPKARARNRIAALIDGKRTGVELELAALEICAGLFPTESEIRRFIRGEIVRSTR